MKRRLGIFLFAVAAVPNADQWERELKRISTLSEEAGNENAHYTEVLKSHNPQLRVKNASKTFKDLGLMISDPNLRLEWHLRLAGDSALISLDELREVTSARLLDEGLWRYYNQQLPQYFLEDKKVQQVHQRVAAFIKARPKIDFLSQAHGEWWRYISLGRLEQEAADAELRAIIEFGEGLRSQSLVRLKNWIYARFHLNIVASGRERMKYFDQRIRQELAREYQKNPRALVQNIYDAISQKVRDVDLFKVHEQKIDLFRLFEESWMNEKNYSLVAMARAYRVELTARLGQPVVAADLIEVGEAYNLAKEAASAAKYYQLVLNLEPDRWEKGLALEGLGKASVYLAMKEKVPEKSTEKSSEKAAEKSAEQKRLLEWGAEYYRRSVEELINTSKRDIVLLNYGEVLESLQLKGAAFDVYETLFLGGNSEDIQVGALLKILDEIADAINHEVDPKMQYRLFSKYVTMLTAFARLHPTDQQLARLFAEAKRERAFLKLETDPILEEKFQIIDRVILTKDGNVPTITKTPPRTNTKKAKGTL